MPCDTVSPMLSSGGQASASIHELFHKQERVWAEHVRLAGTGDHSALARLFDESSPLVYGVALRILGNPADAEEITMDVYTQVWRIATQFDAARGNVSTWLIMLARSRALDRVRAGQRRRESPGPLSESAATRSTVALPDHMFLLNQVRAVLLAALDELSPEQREAIELAFFSELTHTELSAKLSVPLGTVKTRIRLGLIRLRELLGPLVEGRSGQR